ncbi:MAG: NAD-dependent epimerase/dehydratase family protein [Anaerobacillus sp.]
MKLLILGGTRFIGRYVTVKALEKGHHVTLFNRGNNRQAFPEVETLVGDRDGDLSILKGREWDAVIDTSGFIPRTVNKSTKLLRGMVNHYTYISSVSAYRDFGEKPCSESSPLQQISEMEAERITAGTSGPIYNEHYGALKASCEYVAEKNMNNQVLHIRPGLVVGPHDYSDRFTYWVKRIQEGGDVLAPGNPERPVQFIDVRDLANWVLQMTEQHVTGAFNVTGKERMSTMGEVLASCKKVCGSKAVFQWVNEDFLLDNEIAPWTDLPLWLPESMNAAETNIDRALREGLILRPLEETIRDIVKWLPLKKNVKLKAGLTQERELELLRMANVR